MTLFPKETDVLLFMKGNRKRIRSVIVILIPVLLAYLCSAHLFQLMLIQGDSMLPTYHHMQLVLIRKNPEHISEGNVIAFHSETLSADLVKRVVACPGDRIVIQDGTLYINGEISKVYPEEGSFLYAGILDKPVLLSAGQYFVIGDYIAESHDSRYEEVGIVKEESILGVVIPESAVSRQ